ncbi:hypothetical protein V1478_004947 [Vespula squamosa]|uniref:Uncharacterized protein n=1 Tax=Vespula squamosa TaxID=30214 RepID=A0ABD2BF78_VESSQ
MHITWFPFSRLLDKKNAIYILDAGMQDNSRCKIVSKDQLYYTNTHLYGILPAVQSLEPISNSEKNHITKVIFII